MCGIFGYVTSAGAPTDADAAGILSVALRALRHRGPDGSGTYQTTAGNLRVGFAHTRLAILDVSTAARQPMRTADGRYTLVYNGEIYNFRELRAELEAQGVQLTSTGDTEVLLAAFAKWGPPCVERLRGMFAFAVWDDRERALFLARDRLGVKPLYYAEIPGGIAFSSEVRALLETGFARRSLSPEGLSSYFTYGSVREPATILRDVRALPGGCTLRFANGSAEIRRYWSIPLEESSLTSYDEAVERVRAAVARSVEQRLVSDVPVGVFLSSGIDSAAIVALASAASERPVHTFTVVFDDASDEGAGAKAVAERFGCKHEEARLESDQVAAHIEDALAALDQPSADGVNTFVVSRAARRAGLVVALSGIGGDELFAGYDSFLRFVRAQALPRLSLPGFARRAIASVCAQPRVPTNVRKILTWIEQGGGVEETYDVLREVFAPAQRDALVERKVLEHVNGARTMDGAIELAMAERRLDAINAFTALELSRYLTDTLLRDTDQMGMANSLEVREPLLDHELVELVMSIPGSFKTKGIGNKPLLTAAVPDVPQPARRHKKLGFDLPFDRWLRGPLRPFMRERLLSGTGRSPWWMKRAHTERLVQAFEDGARGVSWSRIWCLVAITDWCERNRVTE